MRQPRIFLASMLLSLACMPCTAQILSVDPIFPHDNDTVTIIYDATEGNAALANVIPVYAHTGVITDLSPTPTSWRHVQGNWGTSDPNVLMTPLGNNLHQITYHIRSYYNVPGNETILQLAFVFRNGSGSIVGRDTDGSDIFYPVYPTGQLFAAILSPGESILTVDMGDTIPVHGAASNTAILKLTDNGTQVFQDTTDEFTHTLTASIPGTHEVILTASDSTGTARDTFYYVVNPSSIVAPLPAGSLAGFNDLGNGNFRLRLDAPGKQHVYVLGDFNGYQPDTAYFMRRTPDGNTYWIDLQLAAGQTYTYQYLVDGELKVADPFSTLVLDPSNDGYISSTTYPNRPAYPSGTTGIVSVISPGATPYAWQTNNFQKPASADLVVYELLVRDFVAAHDYQTILDTLDYLERLGVNAIEFMPLNEFEGNESWGYNCSFHMALDKYYGPAHTLKALIDECHARGMAVILDVAYNHAFSQSPFCQLYWDAANFKPSPDNPWLNPDARHPFNVGYDFNHESPWTRAAFIRTVRYWMEEFRFDGFRFDLSKGFTQTYSGSDVGLWGQYDQSRINIWQYYRDSLRATSSDAYLILEHFADNSEETVLQSLGFLLWGNSNYNYNEATMGYVANSNFEWIDYQARGWSVPRVMGYMESHDEERLMYKNIAYGSSAGGYNIRSLPTALKRMELAGNFFFTVPGPKMIWQFGERGYDISIEDPCRVCNKPPHWEYMNDPDRHRLYKVWSALIQLKQGQAVFESSNYHHSLGGTVKKLVLESTMDAHVLGNFGTTDQTFNADFPHTGWWYEYWTGDSINVSDPTMSMTFSAGEYRLYTDARLPLPDLDVVASNPDPSVAAAYGLELWPNPAHDNVHARYELPVSGQVELALYDLMGRKVQVWVAGWQAKGTHELEASLQGIPAGNYLLRVRTEAGDHARPLVIAR